MATEHKADFALFDAGGAQVDIDLLQQTSAIQRALDKLHGMILAQHLSSCVTTALQGDSSADRERVIGELLQVFEAQRKL